MSGAALGWAWKQPVPTASAKFVLVLLADWTTGDLAFMSVQTITRHTGLDRKTVMVAIGRLVEWGLIEDTGERRGRTGSVPVYRLQMHGDLFDNAPYSSGTKSGTGTKNGTASEAVPVLDGSGTVFPTKRSQKRDTDPKQIQDDPSRAQSARAREDEPSAPTSNIVAAKAMIEAGIPACRMNPSHPDLLRALAAGVTPTELADTTRELASRGTGPPGMVYVIRTALGRRRDAQREPSHASQPSQTHRDSRGGDRPRSAAGRSLAAIKRRRSNDTRVEPGTFGAGDG